MTRVYFETDAFVGQELLAADVPALQAFFDDNPEYFYQINDRPPRADEAQSEFDEQVPAHLPHGERWFIGVRERETRSMVAMVNVTAHLGVRHVWHVGLFIVATHLHGQDAAAGIYAALEREIASAGAEWMRLCVVCGNERAERFWARQGYTETRVRRDVDTGGRINDIRVLVKALGSETLGSYLERVPRDRPESELA